MNHFSAPAAVQFPDQQQLESLHQRARALRDRRMRLYRVVRALLRPLFWLCFRPQVEGAERIPAQGGCLLAANHRSFFDSFFQALAIGRPMHWMAKVELFDRPWKAGFLVRCGAFPVRRGASDEMAIETARQLLAAGEMVGVFPEGTRVRETEPGPAKRGAARLALEAGVPSVPMSIVGTERGALRRALWRGHERVRISVGLPVFPPSQITPEQLPQLAEEITQKRIWPQVRAGVRQLENRRNAALAGSVLAGAAAAATALVIRHRRK